MEAQVHRKTHPSWFLIGALGLTIISIYRALYLPAAYPATLLLVNYKHGFIRRGLIGELLSHFNISYHHLYEQFSAVSIALFIATLFATFKVIKALIDTKNIWLQWSTVVFCSSPGLYYLGSTLGYYDHLGIIITVGLLSIRSYNKRFIVSCILFPILILVHEACVFLTLPIILLSFVYQLMDRYVLSRGISLLIFVFVLELITYILSQQKINHAINIEHFLKYQQLVDFTLSRAVLQVQSMTASDNLKMVLHMLKDKQYYTHALCAIFTMIPTLIFFSFTYLKSMRNLALFIAFMIASTAPLALTIFGYDFSRWPAYALTSSFLALYCTVKFCKIYNPARIRSTINIAVLAVCVILFNLNTKLFLNGHIPIRSITNMDSFKITRDN